MQNAPPTPTSPTSMDAMLRLDLATLRTDSVLVYASRVAHLQPSTSLSGEKLRMLFVLSQKLVQWFISERRELERLNHTLQEELLEALRSADGKGTHVDQSHGDDVSKSAVPPPIVCSQDACVQTETAENDHLSESQATQTDSDTASSRDSDSQATQTEVEAMDTSSQTEADTVQERPLCETQAVQTDAQAELVETLVQTDPEEGPPSETQAVQTDAQAELVETLVQTDPEEGPPSETQATQTDAQAERVETSIQTEVAAELVALGIQTDVLLSDSQASQTEIESSETSIQTDAAAECVDGGVQTDDVRVEAADTCSQTDTPVALVEIDIQTDAAAAVVESSVQTERWSEPIECGVQVTIEPEVTECGIQATIEPEVSECGVQAVTQAEVADGCVQTLAVESTSVETQATPVLPATAEQAASTLDLISWVDESTETESVEEEETVAVGTPPLETYFQVQRSVLTLQRIVRGFVTRRRFYRMLTELVNAK